MCTYTARLSPPQEPGSAGAGGVAQPSDLPDRSTAAVHPDSWSLSWSEEAVSAVPGPHGQCGTWGEDWYTRVSVSVPAPTLELLHGRRLYRLRAYPTDT